MKRITAAVFLFAILLLSSVPETQAAFYNPASCDGANDCWMCKRVVMARSVCKFTPFGATGNCGCADFGYGTDMCRTDGDFCERIIVYG